MKDALLRTIPGRVISIGAGVKVLAFVVGLAGVPASYYSGVDTLGSFAIILGGLYFLVKGIGAAQRRLLWRVRRKLILSYIFIGFIPSILIVLFFLLGGLFLFANFSSYLVQNEFRSLTARANAVAAATALDIQRAGGRNMTAVLNRRQSSQSAEMPGFSQAVVSLNGGCPAPPSLSVSLADSPSVPTAPAAKTGPWAHMTPPATLPEWLADCRGFSGVVAHELTPGSSVVGLAVRGVAFAHTDTSSYAIVVDIPFSAELADQLRGNTGVDIRMFQLREPGGGLPRQLGPTPPNPESAGSPAGLTSFTFVAHR